MPVRQAPRKWPFPNCPAPEDRNALIAVFKLDCEKSNSLIAKASFWRRTSFQNLTIERTMKDLQIPVAAFEVRPCFRTTACANEGTAFCVPRLSVAADLNSNDTDRRTSRLAPTAARSLNVTLKSD